MNVYCYNNVRTDSVTCFYLVLVEILLNNDDRYSILAKPNPKTNYKDKI